MKLTTRLGTVARAASDQARERLGRADEPAVPPPPDAPGSRPRAAFAGVLDGRHLWVAVEATPGAIALREVDGGQVVPLASDLVEDDPRWRSVRSDLADLPPTAGAGDTSYDVVMVTTGGGVTAVWTPPLPGDEPLTTPAADGVQWEVGRSADGTLRLTRSPAPAGTLLLGIDADLDEVVTLRVTGADAGAELRLVDDEGGAVLLTRPMTHTDGVATATLAPGDVPDGVGLSMSVHAGDLPVRRRVNELLRPDTAVLLPQHQSDDGQSVAVVYRWLPDGVLRVRRPKAGTP